MLMERLSPEEKLKHLEEAVGARFAEAARMIELHGPVILNLKEAEGPPDEAFEGVVRSLDAMMLGEWRGEDGGTCFFATTQAALMLLGRGGFSDFRVVSGRFVYSDGEDIYHAWLEARLQGKWYAVNISNMHIRPGYMMERGLYREINRCGEIFQEVPADVVRNRAKSFGINPSKHWSNFNKLRRFTKSVLKPTISKIVERRGR